MLKYVPAFSTMNQCKKAVKNRSLQSLSCKKLIEMMLKFVDKKSLEQNFELTSSVRNSASISRV